MKSIVPVVFATDNLFAPYCSTSIASLLNTRDPEREYDIYVFYDQLEEENIQKLNSMSREKARVSCINISPYINAKLLYTRGRQSVATYYRFFAADVLTQYDKILYLDSDIAILRDVGELFDYDLGDNLLGGVVIYRGTPKERRLKEEYLENTMGVRPDQYINAGILSMNLKLFRQEQIRDKCLEYLAQKRELRWMDQDVLNAVCKGRILYLPEKWNMSQLYYEEDYAAGADLSGVCIVHYLDRFKPWWVNFRRCHLFFYQAAAFTPYAQTLTRQFLECNNERFKNPREEVLRLAARGEIGPRYLGRCLRAWLKAKWRKFRKKK